ncbi:hypothetical protein Dsin_023009 [Dipteronia sinensis]|uniref:Uncharacterized protein n=1 Tax=Dipteronia sinensis TaxID=43782 RepID=A0AAE0A2S2_9ROSI|nr:hypothetical protein Dsin_023009 [Dipteronia sinensis]
MVQTLEAIKGGGGSIRVGTTGTIGALMTRELESVKSAPNTPRASVAGAATTAKRLQQRKSLDEASTSGSTSNNINRGNPETARKTKGHTKSTHTIPMLGSDNIALDRTPSRQKTDRKGTNIVEIVDIKCRNPDRAWSKPITSKLKKLGFSKLSESSII